jgi:hypothetical protein
MAGKSGAIRAGRAFVELFADDSRLVRALRRAQALLSAFGERVRGIGAGMTGFGAALLAPLGLAVKSFADMGDALDEMASRTGLSVEALSELGFAAELSGADLETLEVGVRKMQRTLDEAAQGSDSAQAALARLGLTAQQLMKLSPEEQFTLIADRIAAIDDPAKRAALAMELFGKSGTRLLPMMEGGAAGLQDFREQARALGLTISTEMAKDAARASDAMDILWRVLKQGVFVIGSALAPVVTELSHAITRVVVSATSWLKQNREIVVTAAKIAVVVLAAGAALVGVGVIAAGLSAVFGVLASTITVAGTVLAGIGAAIAALLSPIGLAVAAVVGLGTAVLLHTGAAGDALTWLSDRFASLRDGVIKVVGGITDALAAGDIGLAAQILWLGLKLAWEEGVAFLNKVWLSARHFFISTAQKMWYGAVAAAQIGFHALEVAWIETTSFLSKTWTSFSTGFQKIWEQATSFVAKRMLEIQGLFDSSLDVEAAKKNVDKQLESRLAGLDAEAQQALSQREARRKRERSDSAALNEGTLAEIGKQFEEAQSALNAETDGRIAATQAKLDEARKKLDEAIAEAKRKREAADSDPDAPRFRRPDLLSELEDRIAAIGETIASKIDVTGTFNAAAVSGLASGSDAAERTADASEQTARNTKRLVDAASSGGLVFA